MTRENTTNGSQSIIVGAIDDVQTSWDVIDATGWPEPPFRALIKAESGNPDEFIYVGSVSSNTLNDIIRAVEPLGDGSQSATPHSDGATLYQVLTSEGFRRTLPSLGLKVISDIDDKIYQQVSTFISTDTIENGVSVKRPYGGVSAHGAYLFGVDEVIIKEVDWWIDRLGPLPTDALLKFRLEITDATGTNSLIVASDFLGISAGDDSPESSGQLDFSSNIPTITGIDLSVTGGSNEQIKTSAGGVYWVSLNLAHIPS